MACTVQARNTQLASADLPAPIRSVCRRLFEEERSGGPAERSAFLRAVEADLQRRALERWNFDFGAERPLPGRYQWEDRTDGQKAATQRLRRKSGTTQSKITDFLLHRKRHSNSSGTRLKARRIDLCIDPANTPMSTVD